MFLFFQQKTSYEMRMRDWSSDVCSSDLIAGIAHMGDSSALGRIGTRAIALFIIASLISISLGLVMVNLLQPGVGIDMTASAQSVGEVKKLDMFEFIEIGRASCRERVCQYV